MTLLLVKLSTLRCPAKRTPLILAQLMTTSNKSVRKATTAATPVAPSFLSRFMWPVLGVSVLAASVWIQQQPQWRLFSTSSASSDVSSTKGEPSPSFISVPVLGSACKAKNTRETWPKICKGNRCGEDAMFIESLEHSICFGVADGVGGWNDMGIDPALFSWTLVHHAGEVAKEQDSQGKVPMPQQVLDKAHQRLLENRNDSPGSSTACFMTLDKKKNILHTANLGDSGYMIIRKGKIIFRSKEQQVYFNAPYQIAAYPTDMSTANAIIYEAKDADLKLHNLLAGDLVIVGTDGLLDNVFDNEILKEAKAALSKSEDAATMTKNLAQRLTNEARRLAGADRLSPFGKNALAHNRNYWGGKLDDIAVIVLYMTSEESSSLNDDASDSGIENESESEMKAKL